MFMMPMTPANKANPPNTKDTTKRPEHGGHLLVHFHAPMSKTTGVVGMHAFGFQQRRTSATAVSPGTSSLMSRLNRNFVAHVVGMVERRVRRENAVLGLFGVFACLLALVDPSRP